MAKAFRSRISGTSDHYDKYRLFMVVEPIGNDYMKHEQIVLHRCESRSFIENRSAFNLASGYWIRICSHPKWVEKNQCFGSGFRGVLDPDPDPGL